MPGDSPAKAATDRYQPLLARSCVPVSRDDGIGDEEPPVTQFPSGHCPKQKLIDIGTVAITGERPSVCGEQAESPVKRLVAETYGRSRLPLAAAETLIGRDG